MSDFSYSSWAAYREDTGALASNPGDFTEFAAWYGEGSSNIDGTLQDHDNDDQFEGVIGSAGSDQANHTTGGSGGIAGDVAALSFYGTINIGGTVYPVFLDIASADYVVFAQSDNELPASITLADIQKASDGAAFPFCFLQGTQIATAEGECKVDDLQIGDLIRTADGRQVPVKWIGKQKISWPGNVMADERLAPICIAAGVLGNHSDLYVSADHGMFVDGLVIQASALVNGDTIRFVAARELPSEFTYYHVETEDHDVILANGAASETFVDAASRAHFDNYQDYLDLYGAERIIPEMSRRRITCARLLPKDLRRRLGIAEPLALNQALNRAV